MSQPPREYLEDTRPNRLPPGSGLVVAATAMVPFYALIVFAIERVAS